MDQYLELEFEFASYHGNISISLSENHSPAAIGSDKLGIKLVSNDAISSFPCCTARVSYNGEGYLANFGWIQVIKLTEKEKTLDLVDLAPKFSDVNSPYYTWGICPTLFDAPFKIDEQGNPKPNINWTAYTYLTTSKHYLMEKDVTPLTGFSWGYEIDSNREIFIKKLTPIYSNYWNQIVTPILNKKYCDWTFNQYP